jgi:hypothetical protein
MIPTFKNSGIWTWTDLKTDGEEIELRPKLKSYKTHNPPVSASLVLDLQVDTTTLSSLLLQAIIILVGSYFSLSADSLLLL